VDGSYTPLDVPGTTITEAHGINSAGQIVGWFAAGPLNHGFLLSNGSYTTLAVPGARDTFAYGINTTGQIVGVYRPAGGSPHGFLATPP